MATKTAEKKTTTKKAAATAAADPTEALAQEVLVTHLHRVLVRLGEPARVPEIVRELGDEAVTTALARYTMEQHPRRFVAVDRRWDIAQRYLDRQRPQERTLEEIVSLYGAALPHLRRVRRTGPRLRPPARTLRRGRPAPAARPALLPRLRRRLLRPAVLAAGHRGGKGSRRPLLQLPERRRARALRGRRRRGRLGDGPARLRQPPAGRRRRDSRWTTA